MTRYSIQQIKFECLAYIKEFDARMDQWVMGVSGEPLAALAREGIDLSTDIWIWKPAQSPAAATAIFQFFTCRYQVRPAGDAEKPGHCVFMFKRLPPESGTLIAA